MQGVYALSEQTEIVGYSEHEVHLSANPYGKGRGVYIAGLPYSYDNTRLLYRSIYYAAGREDEMKRWFSLDPECEVHAYPHIGKVAVVNNSNQAQCTDYFDGSGKIRKLDLKASEIMWLDMESRK